MRITSPKENTTSLFCDVDWFNVAFNWNDKTLLVDESSNGDIRIYHILNNVITLVYPSSLWRDSYPYIKSVAESIPDELILACRVWHSANAGLPISKYLSMVFG